MAVKWNHAVEEKVKQAVQRGVINGTELVRTTMVEKIQSGNKSGRVYTRGGVTHQASAPGEAPASNSGRLVQSIQTSYEFTIVLKGTVNASTEYAAPLEYGTQKMAERPFARPSLQEKQNEIIQGIADEITGALK